MTYTTLELVGTLFFLLAVLHTFAVGKFVAWAHHYPKDSTFRAIFHLLGEVEVVFALWASAFMAFYIGHRGWAEALHYQQSLNFTEPFFIFAIMVICSTRPVLVAARQGILGLSWILQKIFKTPANVTDIGTTLIVGPLCGSFITEPAAMTVTAFMINSLLEKESIKLKYFVLAVLFVNVSIGGALTHFAAPPILMVAQKWNWDLQFVFSHLGWKSLLAVCLNTLILVVAFRKEISLHGRTLREVETRLASGQAPIPWMVIGVHLCFLVGVVVTGHYQNAFLGLFFLFLAVASVTQRYQDSLRLKESLLVAVFLGGIIQFGEFQKWWLAPLLAQLGDFALFKGAVLLTAITDNAALTYLGSQVEGISEASKYALVAGALAGGGLTLIANAPNAAGYSILSHRFKEGLHPLKLFVAALVPTGVAVCCLWFL